MLESSENPFGNCWDSSKGFVRPGKKKLVENSIKNFYSTFKVVKSV